MQTLRKLPKYPCFYTEYDTFYLFFTKPRKHFCSGWNFDEKKPIFLIMRSWFSFWVCASSFSQEIFLFSAVLGSLRINTLAIKCDKLSDNYKFCYRAVRASLISMKKNDFLFSFLWFALVCSKKSPIMKNSNNKKHHFNYETFIRIWTHKTFK
jgi:hypothetical protein